MRLAESERKVMEVLWERKTSFARDVATVLQTRVGWGKTTTYTMLNRCMEKGYLKRVEPRFRCIPVLTKEEVAQQETEYLICHSFDDKPERLVEKLIQEKKLSVQQMEQLCQLARDVEKA